MSEIQGTENTGTVQAVENDNAGTGSTSILNQVIEAVMDWIDALSLFAKVSRGAPRKGAASKSQICPPGAFSIPFPSWKS